MATDNNISKLKSMLTREPFGDVRICRRQIEGLIGFCDIIIKDAEKLYGGPIPLDDYENPYFRFKFDATQIKNFLQDRLEMKQA